MRKAEVSQGGFLKEVYGPLFFSSARFWDWQEMDECNWMTPPLQLLWLIESLRPGGK